MEKISLRTSPENRSDNCRFCRAGMFGLPGSKNGSHSFRVHLYEVCAWPNDQIYLYEANRIPA